MSLTTDTDSAQPTLDLRDAADGGWLSVAALADRDGLTKPGVMKRVNKLVADGQLETRPGKGKAILINAEQYDRHWGDLAARASAAEADGLWLSVTAIAARDGVTKQTVSERVKKLVAAGEVETRPGKGRAPLVNVAQYDHHRAKHGDAARESGAATKKMAAAAAGDDTGFRDAQSAEKRLSAALKALDYGERSGALVPIAGEHGVADASAKVGGAILRAIEGLKGRAGEIDAAARKDGEHGVRRVLNAVVYDMRSAVERAMLELVQIGKSAAETGQVTVDVTQPRDFELAL